MTPHKLRCETCDGDCLSCDVETYITCETRIMPHDRKSPFDKLIKWKHDHIKITGCYPGINEIWNEVDRIRESDRRCASHSDAIDYEQRIADVIAELEMRLSAANRIGGSYKNGEADAFYDAISLLKGGVK